MNTPNMNLSARKHVHVYDGQTVQRGTFLNSNGNALPLPEGFVDLTALEYEGATTLGLVKLNDRVRDRIMTEVSSLTLEPISYRIKGKKWGKVTGLDWDEIPKLPGALQELATMTEEVLNVIFPPEVLDGPIKFNNFSLRKYPPQMDDIAPPHRDYLRYQNVIALWVLEGPSNFYVCKDLEKTAAQEIKTTEVGQLILMRATGYAGIVERPYHFVGPNETERVTFGLRQVRQA
jgi:hypothetical protein